MIATMILKPDEFVRVLLLQNVMLTDEHDRPYFTLTEADLSVNIYELLLCSYRSVINTTNQAHIRPKSQIVIIVKTILIWLLIGDSFSL